MHRNENPMTPTTKPRLSHPVPPASDEKGSSRQAPMKPFRASHPAFRCRVADHDADDSGRTTCLAPVLIGWCVPRAECQGLSGRAGLGAALRGATWRSCMRRGKGSSWPLRFLCAGWVAGRFFRGRIGVGVWPCVWAWLSVLVLQ